MFSDRERPARIRAEQQRALAGYVRREVAPFSDHERRRLEHAGLDGGRLRTLEDLGRLAPVSVGDLADPGPLVLRPTEARIRHGGSLEMRARLAWARLSGREGVLARTRVDPVYKPVHWAFADGLLVASSAADLDRLAELGRRAMEAAGVRPHDVLVSLLPPGPDLAYWQLALAARRAGLSALYLDRVPSAADVERLRPTVLAGTPSALAALVDDSLSGAGSLGSVRVVLAVGEVDAAPARAHVARMLPGATVATLFAPAGVRALWAQCERGTGLHTWPQAEVVEAVDDDGAPVPAGATGEIVWSPIGWRGTVVLRLRTGLVGRIDDTVCPDCGRTTPRVLPAAFPAALDGQPALGPWIAEVRRAGGEERLVVFASPPDREGDGVVPAMRAVDRQVAVSQFVLVDGDDLDLRRLAGAGRRVRIRSGP